MSVKVRPYLGTAGRKAVHFNTMRLVETRLLLCANSGAGKSYAIRRLLEQTHGQVQQIVIDVEDEFHTLREKYDYVLAGGVGSDCPAEVRSAGLLARRLLELGVSAVVGIGELKKHERHEFVRRFLEALIEAPKNLRHPCLVILDEAHLFAPEKGKAESTAAVIDLMTRGRKRGLCGVLATQRIAKLHKDASAECNNKLIGRFSQDVDMKRAADELGFGSKKDMLSLRELKMGEFYQFGPAFGASYQGVTKIKVSTVQTSHPKIGQRAAPPPPPRKKLAKVLGELKDIPVEAAKEIKSLDYAKKEIAELRRKLTTEKRSPVQSSTAWMKEVDAAYRQGKTEGSAAVVEKLAEVAQVLDNMLPRIQNRFTDMRGQVDEAKVMLTQDLNNVRGLLRQKKPKVAARTVRAVQRSPDFKGNGHKKKHGLEKLKESINEAERETFTKPQLRVLDAVAWWDSIGVEEPTRIQTAFAANYTVSGNFNNICGILKTEGLVTYPPSSKLQLTSTGKEVAEYPDVTPTTEELHNKIRNKLSTPQAKVFDAVFNNWPKPISREDVAGETGYAMSGNFNNICGKLKGLHLINYPRGGMLQAEDSFFLVLE